MLPPFQRVFDEHREVVHRFLVASVGPQEAEDCFQETWSAALRAYPDLRHGDNLRAWVMRIAHHKAIDAHRARTRRPPLEQPEPVPPPEPPDPALWSAVEALPPKQRGAVLLRLVADLAYPQVAVALGCSPEAARRSVHEGVKRLREELDEGSR